MATESTKDERGTFIGVYQLKGNKQSRAPIHERDGKHYDIMNRRVRLADYVLLYAADSAKGKESA